MIKRLLFASTLLCTATATSADNWRSALPDGFATDGLMGGRIGGLLRPIDPDEHRPREAETIWVVVNSAGESHWIYPAEPSQTSPHSRSDWSIDRSGPQIQITAKGAARQLSDGRWLASPETRFEVTVVDAQSGVETQRVLLDGEAVSPPFALNSATGQLQVSARDQAGNQSDLSTTLMLDQQGPDITWQILDSAAVVHQGRSYYRPPVHLQVSAEDPGSGVAALEVHQGEQHILVNSGDSLRIEQDQVHIAATDGLGNSSELVALWHYDDQPPTISVDAGVPSRNNRYQVVVGERIPVTISDPAGVRSAAFAHQFDETPFEGFVVARRTGLYRVKIRATDNLGNTITQTLLFDARRES